jgi:hypothetical protein
MASVPPTTLELKKIPAVVPSGSVVPGVPTGAPKSALPGEL